MDKYLMISDDDSTTLIHEDAYLENKNAFLFTGVPKIIAEFNTETWEEARDMYDDYINKNFKQEDD